jgi:hypothetical protein
MPLKASSWTSRKRLDVQVREGQVIGYVGSMKIRPPDRSGFIGEAFYLSSRREGKWTICLIRFEA